jgi:hypothetical protein
VYAGDIQMRLPVKSLFASGIVFPQLVIDDGKPADVHKKCSSPAPFGDSSNDQFNQYPNPLSEILSQVYVRNHYL